MKPRRLVKYITGYSLAIILPLANAVLRLFYPLIWLMFIASLAMLGLGLEGYSKGAEHWILLPMSLGFFAFYIVYEFLLWLVRPRWQEPQTQGDVVEFVIHDPRANRRPLKPVYEWFR